jgi:hypothetical protein
VPVCASCADRHRAELKHIGFFERILPALKTETTIAFIFPFLTTLFFFSKVLEDVARLKFERALFMMAPVTLFGSIAGVLWWQILSKSQKYSVPPDTIVSGSLSFSSRKKKLFEPERRRFEFRNEAFANAFLEANRERLWDPRSPTAIHARSNRAILQYAAIVVFVAFAIWAAIDEYL